jgi:hypothetical protein
MRTFQLCSGRAARLIVPVLVMALALAGAAAAQTDDTQTDAARAKRRIFLPVAAGNPLPPPLNCDLPNTSYTSLSIAGEPLSVNPDTHPNLNLGVCGYAEVDAPLRLVELGPVHDPRAPQLPGMFGDRRTPAFTNAYQRYRWDANRNCLNDYSSQWEATVLGMGVTREETLYTPDSGYDIGGDYEYLVLYAGETDLTLHIGREDEFFGYVIHIDGVCTDPDLLALYRQNHAAGRGSLPALRGHQAFGVAVGSEIQVAVRDTGSFMDPRSRNDWWQGR